MPMYVIGAYWGSRPSTAEDALGRTSRWAGVLAASGVEGLKDWALRKRPKVVALSAGQVLCPADRILRVMRDEMTGAPDPRFGWSVSLISAGRGSQASELSTMLGATVEPVVNCAVLLARVGQPVSVETLASLMQSAVDIFEPEHAVARDWQPADPEDERPIWLQPSLAAYHR